MKKYFFTTFLFFFVPLQSASFAHPELCYWQDRNGVRTDLSGICGVSSKTPEEAKSEDRRDVVKKVARRTIKD